MKIGWLDRIVVLAALLSIIEVNVLVTWLQLTITAAALVAAGFLFAGILVEELIRYRGITGAFPRGRARGLVVLGVVVETIGWIVPVALQAPAGLIFGILFVALTLEHAIIAMAVSNRFDLRGVVDFSALEAIGGTVWLADPTIGGIVVLAITGVLEHVQGLRQGFGVRA